MSGLSSVDIFFPNLLLIMRMLSSFLSLFDVFSLSHYYYDNVSELLKLIVYDSSFSISVIEYYLLNYLNLLVLFKY